MNRFSLTICLTLIFSSYLYAQESEPAETISSIAEELADDETDPEAVALYTEKLQELKEKPVLLNSADENELSRLFFLTDFQIRALADYINSTGKIASVYEIANIPGFDRELAEITIPFVSLITSKAEPADSTRINSFLLSNISYKRPSSGNPGSGSPFKVLIRYRATADNLSAGFTTEKDSGEKYFTGSPSHPDFLSAHLTWTGSGIIKRIIIGDFGARFGLGTNLNTGLRTGLSLTSSGYLSGGDEIKPYTSAGENNFFRGFAAVARYRKITASLYYSSNRIDATLDSENGVNFDHVESFYTSGLHNSSSLLLKKDAIRETGYGADVALNLKFLRIGLLYSEVRFSLPVIPAYSDLSGLFDFDGDRNTIATGYYKASAGKVIIFGEFSSCLNGRGALVQGASVRPSARLNINILLSKYDPGYTAFHGKAPFSSSSGDNSEGIFANFTLEAAKHLFISAGCDFRKYPWLRFRCSAPSTSVSSEIKFKYLPFEKLSAEAVICFRQKMQDETESRGIKKQVILKTRSFRATLRYSPAKAFILTTRADFRIAGPSGSIGTLLCQDFSCRLQRIPISLWLRYCIFNTDGWDSRIYTYENDLINSFSIPALSGEGSRSYIMIDWRASRLADIRIKYALSDLSADDTGESRSQEIRIQLRLWF